MFHILDVLMALLMPILLLTLIILIAKWIWTSNGYKSNGSDEEIKEQLNRIEGKIDKLNKNQ